MASPVEITPYMREVLRVVIRANADGSFCDLDQIIDRVGYHTTKQSIQFTIRAMIAKGLIIKKGREKRRGRSRVVIAATQLGYQVFNGVQPEQKNELAKLFADF